MHSHLRAALLGAAALVVSAIAAPALADTFVLKSGSTLDGKVVKEDATFVWVKTLTRVEKVPVSDIETRTAGESAVEVYEKLQRQVAKSPDDVPANWELYRFLRDHAAEGLDKEAPKVLAKVLKLAPEHEEARDANDEVKFEGQWVKKSELARLQAAAARRKVQQEWVERLKVPVEVYEADHWLLVDNTGEKDLAARATALDKAYQALREAIGVEEFWTGRAVVITLKEYEDYVRVLDDYASSWKMSPAWMTFAKDRSTGGVWRHRPDPTQLRWIGAGTEGMWSAIVHNAAHVALWKLTRPPREPAAWLDEGLGAWVEIEVSGQQVNSCVSVPPEKTAGGTTDKRKGKRKGAGAEALRDAANQFKEMAVAAVGDGEFPEMRLFLRMKLGEFGPIEEGGALGLVTWLHGRDPEKFIKLIELVRAGNLKDDEIWKQVYGYELVEDMEKDFKTWVLTEW